ncbi:type VII secretion protein EccB [Gordonia alkaliphila]|uniref:type VII secretion protein EccB n=1 Tax=Gordonia alkaliphila TaxID=1053547 RepID=UPI001FF53DA0|nr:type VII secretion protein EccB [Gordonia alkaliphila]MCK0438088.1 type VII secretion protein EccB [Gordonia alkaliphila]
MTTRAQVSGYRFGLARAEHALVRRDARMLHDPMRSQFRALIAGAVVALLVVAGAGIYGLIAPAPSVAQAKIVTSDAGGLYVLVDDVMHPVPNLASARLVVGEPLPAKTVAQSAVSRYPRGSALGIPGAPVALPGPADRAVSSWSVCDDPAGGTAVVAGTLAADPAPSPTGALVRSGSGEWLLYQQQQRGGWRPVRARVQPSSTAVRRALGIDGATARPISPALLNAFPAEPELAVPEIAGRGGPGPGALRAEPVGTVIRLLGVDGRASYFVVLAEGVQPLSVAAAEALRGADVGSAGSVREVSPGVLSRVPVVHRLPLEHFPAGPVALTPAGAVLCRRWEYAGSSAAARESLTVTERLPLPTGARVVGLRAGDGDGPALDGAYLRPGTGERVEVAGAQYYVTDAGVRYRLVGEDVGTVLGLPTAARPAPWPVLSLLPAGPQLARESALVERDLPR